MGNLEVSWENRTVSLMSIHKNLAGQVSTAIELQIRQHRPMLQGVNKNLRHRRARHQYHFLGVNTSSNVGHIRLNVSLLPSRNASEVLTRRKLDIEAMHVADNDLSELREG